MNKPLIIYHANCADGFGAAFAAWLKLGDEAEYVPMSYGKDYSLSENTFEFKDRNIYILDFSFPRDIMDMLFAGAKRVVWLDHHKTAFEMWCGTDHQKEGWFVNNNAPHYICLDHHNSGAKLAWKWFHPDTEVPMFIKHIDDYDRWQFKIEGTKEFNKALRSAQSWNFPQWKELLESDIRPMYKAGKAILRAHDQNVQSVVKGSARECSIVPAIIDSVASYNAPWVWWTDPDNGDTCGANGLAANCPPHLTSDVGHELANQSGTFGLCWTLSQTGLSAKCSLRSNGEYDVSSIAKAFGGGGHRNAAGFEVPLEALIGWLK